jgi:hypothetical protein
VIVRFVTNRSWLMVWRETGAVGNGPPSLRLSGVRPHKGEVGLKDGVDFRLGEQYVKSHLWEGRATLKCHLVGFLVLWHHSERLYTCRLIAL